jgi:hypothetical protein
VTLGTARTHVTHVLGNLGPKAVMTRPITRHTPPEEIMSNLRPLLEHNRVFAATGVHVGLAMKQLFGQRIMPSGEGRRVRLRLEVLP